MSERPAPPKPDSAPAAPDDAPRKAQGDGAPPAAATPPAGPTAPGPGRRRRARRRAGLWTHLSLLLLAVFVLLGAFALSGRSLRAPDWVRDAMIERVNAALPEGRVTIAAVRFRLGTDGSAQIAMQNVGIFDAGGAEIGRLNEIDTALTYNALLQARLKPARIRLSGAQVTLRRRTDGRFDISLGSGGATTASVPGILDLMDGAFALPALELLDQLEARDLTVTLEDARSGRLWQITDGTLQVARAADGLNLSLAFDVFNGTEEVARTIIGVRTSAASSAASIGTSFENARASDIAAQSPALSFLGVLQAPISGAMRAEFTETGALGSLAGTLDIGAGALRPTERIEPVEFRSAKAYFEFSPETRKLSFSDITLRSDTVSLSARGQAILGDFEDGWPSTMVAQLALSDIQAHPPGYYDSPLAFSDGALDLRVRLKPFSIDIGQFVLDQAQEKMVASGRVVAGPEGWRVAGDMTVNRMSNERLLRLWPVPVVPRTRAWIAANINAASFRNIHGAIRIVPGQPARRLLSWDFSGLRMRYIRTQPEIRNARGYASLQDNTFTLVAEEGEVQAPMGGRIDISGSVFQIPDVSIRHGAPARLRLKGTASTTAVLSLLDAAPFRILRNTDFGPDLARGKARFSAAIDFDLKPKITFGDVTLDARARLSDLVSDTLAPGHVLRAREMALRADNSAVEIEGPVRVGPVHADVLWHQDIAPGSDGSSTLTGSVDLGENFVREFAIGLPRGSVSGNGRGQFTLTLRRGRAPGFTLRSDLNRVQLRVPQIGWTKPKNVRARLLAEGRLGRHPSVDLLELSGAGLEALGGRVTLNDRNELDLASFARLRVGGWLDAPVTLHGRGARRAPEVEVSGGTLDIRKTALATGGPGAGASGETAAGGAAAGGGPLTLNLERVVISEGMTLTGFSGNFDTANGLSGFFSARMNGQAALSGKLAPAPHGTLVTLTSDNAGGVLRAAGVVKYANRGSLKLTLTPQPEKGEYLGHMQIYDTRVVNAPGLAELVSAISIVGLLDQLSGEGISFDDVKADFRLTPQKVILTQSSAVGPSLGISLDGTYDLASGKMDMRGVFSPVFFLNGIGQVFSRRGEGLFGFSFTLRGTSEKPDVRVNPLSILTPGAFREIFRTAPPAPAPDGSSGQ